METISVGLTGFYFLFPLKFFVVIFFVVQLNLIDYFGNQQEAAERAQHLQNLQSTHHAFDYIIVGGGTAGCVLANRLSENPNTTVLLLERGGDPNPLTAIPILSSTNALTGSKKIMTTLSTTKQKNTCLASNGTCTLYIGKNLGGTTNINAQLYTRGSPQIFDKWAEITKNRKWEYKNVLKFFKESEDYHGYYQPTDSKYHSTGGEWYIGNTDRESTSPALQYFFTAAEKAGYSFIDPNNGDEARHGGYGHNDFYIKNGERWNTYKAFIQPILHRSNLHIYRYSRAIKINFPLHQGLRATGVSYIRNEVITEAYAKKEVILSAGVFGSAELLMRSGIGPKDHLESLDIRVHRDLPVGKTLFDHFYIALVFSVNKTLFSYPERDTTASDVIKYLFSRSGYFGKALSEAAFIYMKSSMAKKIKNSYPDFELFYGSLFLIPLPTSDTNKDYFYTGLFNLNPKSNGKFKLGSKHVDDDFLINPNYLSHPDDLRVMTDGIQNTIRLFETSPEFQALGIELLEPLPACKQFEFKTEEYWECYARMHGGSSYHFVGTCRMGADRGDPNAVVDSELKVLGVAGLRVVDASVMPIIPNAHPTAAIVMMAEMGSNFILHDHSYKKH